MLFIDFYGNGKSSDSGGNLVLRGVSTWNQSGTSISNSILSVEQFKYGTAESNGKPFIYTIGPLKSGGASYDPLSYSTRINKDLNYVEYSYFAGGYDFPILPARGNSAFAVIEDFFSFYIIR